MTSLGAIPAVHPPTKRGVLWVLRGAVAAAAIAAWLIVLLHLVLVVQAELRLAETVRQANAFANLPRVDSGELAEYTHRRLAAAGFQASRVTVAAQPHRPGKLTIEKIEASADSTMPRTIQTFCRWLGDRPIAAGAVGPRWSLLESRD
jgi:hypothetical protein